MLWSDGNHGDGGAGDGNHENGDPRGVDSPTTEHYFYTSCIYCALSDHWLVIAERNFQFELYIFQSYIVIMFLLPWTRIDIRTIKIQILSWLMTRYTLFQNSRVAPTSFSRKLRQELILNCRPYGPVHVSIPYSRSAWWTSEAKTLAEATKLCLGLQRASDLSRVLSVAR